MKSWIALILGTCILIACNESTIEKVEDTYDNQQPKKVSFYQLVDGKEVKVEEKEFYANGQLKMSGKLENGLREGEWKAYFEDGKVQSEGFFTAGKRTGSAKVYFPNGQLRYEGQYEDNEQVGHWKFYNEKGTLVTEKDY
ncbi:MAG: hypothetical protein KDD41_10150 [Flavobacteriales bacterium]|nr:hypothetical protein [Flavobacteriales bacterium]